MAINFNIARVVKPIYSATYDGIDLLRINVNGKELLYQPLEFTYNGSGYTVGVKEGVRLKGEITIPGSYRHRRVNTIKPECFKDQTELTAVYFGSMTYIGDEAFANCSNLKYVGGVGSRSQPNVLHVFEYGASVFAGCNIPYIIFPDYSEVSFRPIGTNALSGVNYIFFEGSKTAWDDWGQDTVPLDKVYFYSKEDPGEIGKYWHYNEKDVPVLWFSECDINGHTSPVLQETQDPTCSEAGWNRYVCLSCGEEYTKEIPATGIHKYGDWTIDLDPTCAVTGSKHRVCGDCNHIEHETIKTLEHNYTSVVTPPTCTEQGYTTHTCSTCGDSYADTYTNALEHNWSDWAILLEPTCTKTGTKRRGCSRCDAYETETVAALGHSWSNWEFDVGTGRSYRKCEVCGTIEENKILEFISIGGDKYSVRASRTDLSGVIEIPSFDGKVVSIYKGGFKNCTGIKYIVLPDSITTIGYSAFENCYDLERVQIGRESKLTLIDSYAFYNCYSLTQIVLPKSLDYVGLGAFNNKWCAFLYEGNSTDWKTYAPTVTSCPVITDNLYYYTDNSVSAAGSSDTYWKYVDNSPEIVYGASDVGHFTFTELDDGTYSVKATDVSKLPEYVYIPKEYNGKAVTKIDESGFAYNEKVKLYEIPDTIVEIGTGAFYQNISLSKVRFSFGSRLKTIGIDAFGYNKQLATLSSPKASIGEVPSCVTTMLYNAFSHCEKLTKAVIPPKVTTAHEFVFNDCTSVETIELNNVKHINRSAFWECSPISLDIPASVEFIDNTAFGNCSETLESITVDEDNQYYYAEGNCLIRKSDNALLLGCVNSEIPSSVTKILPGAFYGVKGVVITIPSTVTEIGSGAFVESPNTTIRVPMHEAPMKWDINWCDDTVKVIWGYTEGGDSCSHYYGGWLTTVLSTCTRPGTMKRTCSICGDVEIASIDALGHISSDWIIDVEATTETEGSKHKECTRCGVVLETATIPMLDNNTYLVTESGEYLTDEQGNLLIL